MLAVRLEKKCDTVWHIHLGHDASAVVRKMEDAIRQSLFVTVPEMVAAARRKETNT